MSGRLRGSAFVSVVEPTDFGQLDDFAQSKRLNISRVRSILVQGEMSPGQLVVVDVVGQQPAEMDLTEHDDVIQQLTPNRSDETLDVGILPG